MSDFLKRYILILSTFIFSLILFPKLNAQIDSSYLSNVAIDVIKHDGAIWLTSGEGLSFSSDNGLSWVSIVEGNGLVSSNISSIFSMPLFSGQRLWVGSSHTEQINDANISISDGLSYSDNNGNSWTQINFGPDGLNIPYIWGGSQTVFDITGHFDINNSDFDNWLFFSSFAGGFLASKDGGINWRRIYGSVADSIQYNDIFQIPSFRNRFFSCAADTSHGDSLYVWAGTALGLFSFRYSEPKDKLSSGIINKIEFSISNDYLYIGGFDAFMRGGKTGFPFISRFDTDGLPGENITAIKEFGSRVFVGTVNNDSDTPQLAISDDYGNSFNQVDIPQISNATNFITDFTVMNDRIYMSASEAGLFVSNDTGNNWNHIYIDSSDISSGNLRNNVNSIFANGDTLLVGTDSGLVHLFMDVNGIIDSSRYFVFPEDNSSSTKITKINIQNFQGNDVIWTINRPLTATGTSFVGRSSDDGLNFSHFLVGINNSDIDFLGDTSFVTGENGILISIDNSEPSQLLEIYKFDESVAVDSLTLDIITTMGIKEDTIFVGTDNGLAFSVDRGLTYDIIRINTDSLQADDIKYYDNNTPGILSDWFPAIGVQYVDGESARIWASSRPSVLGSDGISVFYQDEWINVLDIFSWNFAFNGDTVFAASNSGLFWAESNNLLSDPLYEWRTVEFIDEFGEQTILPNARIFGVEILDDNLWVVTSDRTVRINLNNLSNQIPYYVTDYETSAVEVYSYPTPFSHNSDIALDFHFVLEQDANITIEIYDFAMNLVARVIDNEPFLAGVYPTFGSNRPTWDGKNGNGDEVAVGIYYFKVELSTGEIRWGKIAVIP